MTENNLENKNVSSMKLHAIVTFTEERHWLRGSNPNLHSCLDLLHLADKTHVQDLVCALLLFNTKSNKTYMKRNKGKS